MVTARVISQKPHPHACIAPVQTADAIACTPLLTDPDMHLGAYTVD
jgi:hypothetical protein